MTASKFTDAQKALVIKQGEEGGPVAEVCRKAGISQATYFNWKSNYGAGVASDTTSSSFSAAEIMSDTRERVTTG